MSNNGKIKEPQKRLPKNKTLLQNKKKSSKVEPTQEMSIVSSLSHDPKLQEDTLETEELLVIESDLDSSINIKNIAYISDDRNNRDNDYNANDEDSEDNEDSDNDLINLENLANPLWSDMENMENNNMENSNDANNNTSAPMLAISAREYRSNDADLPVATKTNLPVLHTKNSFQLYLKEVSRFPLLTPEEELDFTHKVRDFGDTDAAFRIISSHLRLVVRIAVDFQRRWMQNVLDLVQEGNVGLMRAVNKFDPDKGIKFSYYATFWIKAYILKFIMDNWRMVKVGTTQTQRKLFYNLNKERQKLMAQGFDPNAESLAQALGVTVDQVIEMQQRLDTSDLSLDLPVGDEGGGSTYLDFLPALGPGIEDGFAKQEMVELVRAGIQGILPSLSEKESFILEKRLLTDDPVTLREIGEKYNVTRERIRQLEARLLVKLRKHLGDEIKDFSEDWINS